jgi:hypothetical protein
VAVRLADDSADAAISAAAGTFSGKLTANASADVKNGATSSGVLAIFEDSDDGTNKATFQVPALAGDTVYTLPADDGDSGQVLSTNGSGTMDWITPGTLSKSFTITAVTSAGDFGAIWKTPQAITITAVNVVQVGATNVIGHLDECDSNGANCSAVDSADITADGLNDADDGSLSNASIDANDWIGWHTTSVSGTNTRITVTFNYTVN